MSSIGAMLETQADKLYRRLEVLANEEDARAREAASPNPTHNGNHGSISQEVTKREYDAAVAILDTFKQEEFSAKIRLNEGRTAPPVHRTDPRRTLREILKAYEWEVNGQDQVISAQGAVVQGTESLVRIQEQMIQVLEARMQKMEMEFNKTKLELRGLTIEMARQRQQHSGRHIIDTKPIEKMESDEDIKPIVRFLYELGVG